MNAWWKNLNLTAQERKFVVVVGVAFVLVLNGLFIWPQFGKWKGVKEELGDKGKLLSEYQAQIDGLPKLKAKLAGLETNSTSLTVTADPGTHFQRTVQSLAQQKRFFADSWGTPTVNRNSTNKFFEEHSMTLRFSNTGEKELIDFMYGLSEGNSSVRVRDFSVRPDGSKTKLQGQLVLVASYQVDKTAVRTAARPAPTPASTKSPNPTTKTP
jgi:hypothetical protein